MTKIKESYEEELTTVLSAMLGCEAVSYTHLDVYKRQDKGSQPNAEDGIRNKDDLPEETRYEWKDVYKRQI